MLGNQLKRTRMEARGSIHLNDISKRLPLRMPWIENEDDVEEIKRLMKRKIPSLPDDDVDYTCAICYDQDHYLEKCPWLKKIPPGKIVGPGFDEVCIDCGKIGGCISCCSSGSYAVSKNCCFCCRRGHWYWEDRCYSNFILNPSLEKFWLPIKNSVDKDTDKDKDKETTEQSCWTCKYCGKENKNNEEIIVHKGIPVDVSCGQEQKGMDFPAKKRKLIVVLKTKTKTNYDETKHSVITT